MAVLVARYLPQDDDGEPAILWKYPLRANQKITIGRAGAAPEGTVEQSLSDREVFEGVDSVPDHSVRAISWRHVSVTWLPGRSRMKVEIRTSPRRPSNRITGPNKQTGDVMELEPDQAFQIGPFTFTLSETEREYATRSIESARQGTGSLEDVLINGLTEVVSRFRPSDVDHQFHAQFVQGMRIAFPTAAEMGVAVLRPNGEIEFEACDPLQFGFSNTVVRNALKTQEVVEYSRQAASESGFTSVAHIDWAVCAPIRSTRQDDPRHAIYLSGGGGTSTLPQARQVAALFAEVYRSLNDLRETNTRYRALLKFLPKPVRPLVDRPNFDELLAPVERTVTVLFCDIRGSCSLSSPTDDLQRQWNGVVLQALELMSRAIVTQDGVIGGLIGDAVMGFWGWPTQYPDQRARAIRAARAIHEGFQHTLARGNRVGSLGFGIGIAHGPAIVGRMGNFDMHKVDVFGPTVNLSSRLESMTKAFGVRVLADRAVLEDKLSESLETDIGYRELARVVPAGFTEAIRIFEIFPDSAETPAWSVLENYERSRRAFEGGNWREAQRLLARNTSDDGPSRFLAEWIETHKAALDALPPGEVGCIRFTK